MGSIIRLNTVFNNAKLKVLQDYNTDEIKSQLLSLPTLRAFYDATDVSTMTMSNNIVTKLNDQSANRLHFVQSNTANAPTYNAQAFGHTGGLVFGGNQWLTATNFFGAKQVGSIVIFAKGNSSELNVLLSSNSMTALACYTRQGGIGAFSGATWARSQTAYIEPTNFVFAYDATAKIGNIITHNSTPDMSGINITIVRSTANLGRWTDSSTSGNYIGNIGHVMMFDEDLSKNQAVLALVQEYAKRKYRV